MGAIRAFIAVEIYDQAKQKISGLISNLKKSDTDLKWITEDQMHITLKFLGNVDKNAIQGISEEISNISSTFNSFRINFYKIGAFPDLKHPNVLWLGIDKGASDLKMLNKKIENALGKLGFKVENREFKPHLTLARIKSLKNISNLTKLVEEMDFNSWDDLEINKLALYQSSLTPKGAIHTIITEKYLMG